jgi:polysaccharide export outer membrane protein
MKWLAIILLAIAAAGSGTAQQQPDQNHADTVAAAPGSGFKTAVQKLGKGDVINVSVYEAPELTRNVAVDADGNIRLPFVRQHIHAVGLIPDELEKVIADALIEEQVMISPIVMVTVVEQHSRSISVIGAVRNPTTFQVGGTLTLLEAIIRAGGVSEGAGENILVSHPSPSGDRSIGLTERIPVRSLMDPSDPAASLPLEGGETIRVPVAGQVWVVGDVKRPGVFTVSGSGSTVIRAMALIGGLDSFASRTAYIYRTDESNGRKNEIPIPIKKILARKSPDLPLYGDDLVFVPNVTGERIGAKTFEIAVGVGLAITGLLLYLIQ